MMKLSSFLILTALSLAYLTCMAYATYTCTTADQATVCPVFKNTGIGASNLPSVSMITAKGIYDSQGDSTIQFSIPFCRQCGFIFSFYPISVTDGYPNLVQDDLLTSLNANIVKSGTWSDYWATGNSMCDPAASGALMEASNTLTSVDTVDPCDLTRTIRYMSFDDKRSLALPAAYNNKPVFAMTQDSASSSVSLSAIIYAQAVYPYSIATSADKYATLRSTFTFTTTYLLHADITTAAEVITQKNILVQLTASSPVVLQANLELTTAPSYYWVEGSCATPSDAPWGVKVASMSVQGNVATIILLAAQSEARYTGLITFTCKIQQCTEANLCQTPQTNTFQVQVDQNTPDQIITTSQFTPYMQQFSGPIDQPFQNQLSLASSGDYWVSIGIGFHEYLTGFTSAITDLTMCSVSCTNSPEYSIDLVSNAAVNSDNDYVGILGFQLYTTAQMNTYRPDLGGGAPLGFSFQYAAVKSLRYNVWTFEISLDFTPSGRKRRLSHYVTLSITGTLDDNSGDNKQSAFIMQSLELIPDGSSSTTSPTTKPSSSSWNKTPAIVAPIVAVVACIACTFGIIFLAGICIVGTVIRRRRARSGIQNPHQQMDEDSVTASDVEIPSDSELVHHA